MERTAAATVALLLVVAGVAATPLAAADPNDESASFGNDGYVTVVRGDDVDISVSHSTNANLTIGSQSDGFEVRVPLGGSGTDTVTLQTYNTTSADPTDFLSVGSAELVSSPIDQSLEPGKYRLSVTIDGVEQAAGTLEVLPRGETTGTAGIAPDDLDFEEQDVGGVLGSVSDRDTVARDDYAAVVVNESGLGWALPESSTDARLDSAIEAEVVEIDPEPNTVAETYSGGEVHVVSDVGESDEFAVFWDADVAPHRNSNNTYEFRVTLTSSSNLVEEDEVLVRERVTVVRPDVELSASPSFALAPWDDRQLRVEGQTNLAPQTTLDVRALQETPQAKLWRNVVEVGADGSFTTDFSFSTAAVPSEFPLWVLNYRGESEETVELTEAEGSLSFADQQVDQGAVTVENVSLSHGGFVEVVRSNNSSTLGVSRQLGVGDHGNVSVPLVDRLGNETVLTARAVADANRNGTLDDSDAAYRVDGAVVEANATVSPEPEPANDTTTVTNETTTEPGNETAAPTTTQRSLDTEESVPLTPNQAGGGGSAGGTMPLSPVLVAVALAAAAVLAGRQ
ncbi:DUF7282 domain-containing protein [Halobacterium rubrum]|uniref:DUF7282 domain-containing protein n=1 Tax=Halobacterium TaxID=2239 RepID=UPI001F3F258B|nr:MULTISPECIES: hypothetical protein [Halobacterium]MDH5020197.1 hypothetical protein [Halobacterium rubrum]